MLKQCYTNTFKTLVLLLCCSYLHTAKAEELYIPYYDYTDNDDAYVAPIRPWNPPKAEEPAKEPTEPTPNTSDELFDPYANGNLPYPVEDNDAQYTIPTGITGGGWEETEKQFEQYFDNDSDYVPLKQPPGDSGFTPPVQTPSDELFDPYANGNLPYPTEDNDAIYDYYQDY